MSHKIDADIVVVGAGLVGMAAAVACAKLGKKIVLVDSKKPNTQPKSTEPKSTEAKSTALKKGWDERIYALTTSTVAWLQALEIWHDVDENRVNDINAMQLWDEQGDKLVLQDSDANLANLGVIIENKNLHNALNQQMSELGVTVITDATCDFLENSEQAIKLHLLDGCCISAKLIVAADGVDSWLRGQVGIIVKIKDFKQTAVVANFLAEKAHQNIARQWFAPHETLALLPLPHKHVSMVWALSTEQAAELLTLSNAALAEKVQVRTHSELGNLNMVGNALSFTLQQQTATQLIAPRMVLVGDAAHQIHPMAGQGMNLGLRDVRQLVDLLTNTHAMQDIGETTFLRKYVRARQADIATMNTLTSGLDALFASNSEILKRAGTWGFKQLNQQAKLKELLIKQAA